MMQKTAVFLCFATTLSNLSLFKVIFVTHILQYIFYHLHILYFS